MEPDIASPIKKENDSEMEEVNADIAQITVKVDALINFVKLTAILSKSEP